MAESGMDDSASSQKSLPVFTRSFSRSRSSTGRLVSGITVQIPSSKSHPSSSSHTSSATFQKLTPVITSAKRLSFISSRGVAIVLGPPLHDPDLDNSDFNYRDDARAVIAKPVETINDLPDDCLMSIMAHVKSVEQWTTLKLVCKRWCQVANKALITLQLREASALTSPSFVPSLANFSNLKSLQISIPTSDILTDVILVGIGSACPQIQSLHVTYLEASHSKSQIDVQGSGGESGPSKVFLTDFGLDVVFRNCENLRAFSLATIPQSQDHSLIPSFSLPESIGHLCYLKQLALHGHVISSLPETLGNLRNLQDLTVGCSKLLTLPSSLGELINLESLDLSGCQSLQELPGSLGRLQNLKLLDLEGCEALLQLPAEIGKLGSLESLSCRGCISLQNVPDEIGDLKDTLIEMDFQGCVELTELPYSTAMLTGLRRLVLRDCPSLIIYPEMAQCFPNLGGSYLAELLGLLLPRMADLEGR